MCIQRCWRAPGFEKPRTLDISRSTEEIQYKYKFIHVDTYNLSNIHWYIYIYLFIYLYTVYICIYIYIYTCVLSYIFHSLTFLDAQDVPDGNPIVAQSWPGWNLFKRRIELLAGPAECFGFCPKFHQFVSHMSAVEAVEAVSSLVFFWHMDVIDVTMDCYGLLCTIWLFNIAMENHRF